MTTAGRETQIIRIHGDPEQWLRDFVDHELSQHKGKIAGVCLHLEILEEGGESSFSQCYKDWPSTAQLIGRLFTTATDLAQRIMDKPG